MPQNVCRVVLPFVFVLSATAVVAAERADWSKHPDNCWVKQSPREGVPAPKFGWEGSGSYDPFQRKWIHFGGHDGIPQGFHLFTFDLDSGTWEQRFPNTSPPGVCCVDGANVFDPAARRFVRFPGASLGHGYQWSRGVKLKNSHVWLYDLASNAWTNMRPAPYQPFLAREGLGYMDGGATYDGNHELALSFGGQGSSGGTNNLFAYDAFSNTLHRIVASNPPSPRDGMGIVYDTKNDCLIVFGSQYDNDEKTWTYRYATNRWESHDLTPHPPGKKAGTYATIPKMAYDTLNEECLCIVWDTNSGVHETWTFDAGKLQWTKQQPAVEATPSMSRSRNLSFSEEHNLFILETTSKESKGNGPEIWTYRLRRAPTDKRPAPPSDVHLSTDSGKVVLTWTASASGTASHNIYRGEGDKPWTVQFQKIGTVATNSYTDATSATGKLYFYMVRAVGADGQESRDSFRVRTQPRVALKPVVSVFAADKVEVAWNAHPDKDIAGYNVYRGTVRIRAVTKGTPQAWRDNDPAYAEPIPVEVQDITDLQRLNDQLLTERIFVDTRVDLCKTKPEATEYRFQVFAYIVRAVNKMGVESGPSPYALTIPSEPVNVFNREKNKTAELKWDANSEKGITGYHIYKLEGTWNIVRVTEQPVQATSFLHEAGSNKTRFWIVAVDSLGQEGQPSSPVWHNQSYKGFFAGDWHQ